MHQAICACIRYSLDLCDGLQARSHRRPLWWWRKEAMKMTRSWAGLKRQTWGRRLEGVPFWPGEASRWGFFWRMVSWSPETAFCPYTTWYGNDVLYWSLHESRRVLTGILTQGKKFVGDLLNDGKIRWVETGQIFNSPSAWATHCKRLVNPAKKSGCGWASVRYRGQKLVQYKTTWLHKYQPSADMVSNILKNRSFLKHPRICLRFVVLTTEPDKRRRGWWDGRWRWGRGEDSHANGGQD